MRLLLLNFFLILSLGGLTSCGTPELRPDASPAAIAEGYNSVEFSCGKHDVGVSGCVVKQGQKTDSVNFRIRTILKGTLRIYSKRCGIDWNIRYTKSEWMQMPLKELIGDTFLKSCLLTVTMFPSYPGQKDNDVKVHGFKGQFYIKTLDDQSIPAKLIWKTEFGRWGLLPIQVRRPLTVSVLNNKNPTDFFVDLNNSQKGFWRLQGCGKVYEGAYNNTKYLTFDLIKLTDDLPKGCILQGAIVPEDQPKDLLFTVLLSTYSLDYLHLARPYVYIKGDKLYIEGEDSVSYTIVTVNFGKNRVYNEYKLKTDYSPNDTYSVRQYTVKGRLFIGKIKGNKWIWLQ